MNHGFFYKTVQALAVAGACVTLGACGGDGSETTGNNAAVVQEANGLIAESKATATGIVTTLTDANHNVLATLEYTAATKAAVVRYEAEQLSVPLDLSGIGDMTLDAANDVLINLYQTQRDVGVDPTQRWCCWWGDYSYCGHWGDPETGGTVCCSLFC